MCGTPPSGAAGAAFGSAGSNPTVDLGDKDRTAVGLSFNADVNTTITNLGSHILNLGGDGIVKHGTVGRKLECCASSNCSDTFSAVCFKMELCWYYRVGLAQRRL